LPQKEKKRRAAVFTKKNPKKKAQLGSLYPEGGFPPSPARGKKGKKRQDGFYGGKRDGAIGGKNAPQERKK